MSENNELKIASSFGMKLDKTDAKRTEISFTLDLSERSREEIAAYAVIALTGMINNDLRDGKRKLEDVQGKEIVVPVFQKGERGKGKVSPEKAKEVLAASLGITVEMFDLLMTKVKGAIK